MGVVYFNTQVQYAHVPTPEVAATVRDHHVHQHILDLAAFNSLFKLDTLALIKDAASGRSRDYAVCGVSKISLK